MDHTNITFQDLGLSQEILMALEKKGIRLSHPGAG